MPGWLCVGVEVAGRWVASISQGARLASQPTNVTLGTTFIPPSIFRIELISGVEPAMLPVIARRKSRQIQCSFPPKTNGQNR